MGKVSKGEPFKGNYTLEEFVRIPKQKYLYMSRHIHT